MVSAIQFLRRSDVEQLTGLSRSTIYRFIQAGTFPRPISIGGRSVRWRSSDVTAWMGHCKEKEVA
jgi:prophage regulatory protein